MIYECVRIRQHVLELSDLKRGDFDSKPILLFPIFGTSAKFDLRFQILAERSWGENMTKPEDDQGRTYGPDISRFAAGCIKEECLSASRFSVGRPIIGVPPHSSSTASSLPAAVARPLARTLPYLLIRSSPPLRSDAFPAHHSLRHWVAI